MATDRITYLPENDTLTIRRGGRVRASDDRLFIMPPRGADFVKLSEDSPTVTGDAFREHGDGMSGPDGRRIEDWRWYLKGLDEEWGNPIAVEYRAGGFVRRDNGAPVDRAAGILMLSGHDSYPVLILAYSPR